MISTCGFSRNTSRIASFWIRFDPTANPARNSAKTTKATRHDLLFPPAHRSPWNPAPCRCTRSCPARCSLPHLRIDPLEFLHGLSNSGSSTQVPTISLKSRFISASALIRGAAPFTPNPRAIASTATSCTDFPSDSAFFCRANSTSLGSCSNVKRHTRNYNINSYPTTAKTRPQSTIHRYHSPMPRIDLRKSFTLADMRQKARRPPRPQSKIENRNGGGGKIPPPIPTMPSPNSSSTSTWNSASPPTPSKPTPETSAISLLSASPSTPPSRQPIPPPSPPTSSTPRPV